MADMNDIPENSFLWDGADEASTGRSHGAEPAWKRNRGPVMDDCELPGFTDEHKADPRALFTTFALGSPRTDDWGFKMDTPDDLDQRRFAKAQPAPGLFLASWSSGSSWQANHNLLYNHHGWDHNLLLMT